MAALAKPTDRKELESLYSTDRDPAYFSRLRRRLATGLLALYLAPLLVLALLFEHYYTRTQQKALSTHLRSVAENKRNAVSLFLQERVANTAAPTASIERRRQRR